MKKLFSSVSTVALALVAAMAAKLDAALRGQRTQWREATQPRRRKGAAAGSYGRGILKAQARRNRALMEMGKLGPRVRPHNGDGAYTIIGREPRRMWLGGISAQRGY